ncbi:MAG: hypothetical protein K8T20_18995 [Planctomycetes bacterium]|nr:hypothetical protein [Planctomycetota bacterium]
MRHAFGRRRHSPALRAGVLGAIGVLGLGGVLWKYPGVWRVAMLRSGVAPQRTVEQVIAEYGAKSEARFAPVCKQFGLPWPPTKVRVLAFKRERKVEVWVAGRRGVYFKAADYDVLAASGGPGPKRREGDKQVPEGFYTFDSLNPNSLFHLSAHVSYPNADDVAHASVDPSKLGGDIMMHGGAASIGCLAIGDEAIEEVFCLLAKVPESRREIWIAPVDFRRDAAWTAPGAEPWVKEMYATMATKLRNEHAVK